MSFPGTANFVGEFLIFTGLFMKNDFLVILSALSVVLSAIYSIWIYNRVVYGTLKIESENVSNYTDLNRDEFYILVILTIAMLILGIHSSFVTTLTNMPINAILEIVEQKILKVFVLRKVWIHNIFQVDSGLNWKILKIILENNFIKYFLTKVSLSFTKT